jgi:hypothetical protein
MALTWCDAISESPLWCLDVLGSSVSRIDDHGKEEWLVNGEVSWRPASFSVSITTSKTKSQNNLMRPQSSPHSHALDGDTCIRSIKGPVCCLELSNE